MWVQTHHAQCPAEPRMYPDIDCEIFDHPTPMTLALSVLVIIEMLNALNRYLPAYLASRVPVSMRQLLTGEEGCHRNNAAVHRSSSVNCSYVYFAILRNEGFDY